MLHELIPRTDLTATAAIHYGQTDRLLGRPREARAVFEAGLAAEGSAGVQVLHAELADLGLEEGDFTAASQHAVLAVEVARVDEDQAGEAGARSLAALAQLYSGDVTAARDNAARAARLIDGVPDTILIRDLACLNRLGMTESALELLADAERHLARGLRLSRCTGQTHIRPDLLKSLADVQLRQGNLAQALDTIGEARDASQGDLPLSTLVETMYAEALLWRGTSKDTALVVASAERAIQMCTGFTATWAIVGQVSSADVLIHAGQPERGSRLLARAAGGSQLPRLAPARRTRWWESLVTAACARLDTGLVEHLAERAMSDPATRVSAARRGYLLRIQMRLASLQADTVSVNEHADAAAEAFASTGMRLEVCRTRVDAARLCADAGDTGPTTLRQLDEAHDLAGQCGSLRLLGDIDQLRRRLDRPGGSALTDRELEVAALARTGMRSKEIANNLFVSVRTVDTHLSHIYRKLGVSTRTELANMSLDGGDTPQ